MIPHATSEVQYEHETHTYHYGNTLYRSATQLVDQFRNRFDTLERSTYMASRYGKTPEYWQQKWKDHNSNSLTRGNNIHNEQEDFLHGRGFTPVNGKVYRVWNLNAPNLWSEYDKAIGISSSWFKEPGNPFGNPFRYMKPYQLFPDGTYPELKLWDHNWRIAGRADKPTFETISRVRYIHIEDYKTNYRIPRESFQDSKTKEYMMMLGPLSHLMDCEWNHYALQLSLYQFMGEFFGFKPGIRRIIHFPHEIEGLGVPNPIVHELPYLREEVLLMLNHLTENKWLNQPLKPIYRTLELSPINTTQPVEA